MADQTIDVSPELFDQIAAEQQSAPTITVSPEIFDRMAAEYAPTPLTAREQALGYARSTLSGPTLNFGDEGEAYAVALMDRFFGSGAPISEGYGKELASIHAEQSRFKEQTDYLDNAVEIAASFANPIAGLGALAKGARAVQAGGAIPTLFGRAIPNVATKALALSPTVNRVVTNPFTQAFVAGAGAAEEGESRLDKGALYGAVGAAGSALADVTGSLLGGLKRGAERLKLSSYGIKNAEVAKQVKKLGGRADELADASEIPLVTTLDRAERGGLIEAGKDAVTNAKSIAGYQRTVADKLHGVLTGVDGVVAPSPAFGTSRAQRYVESLSGSARENAQAAMDREVTALQGQVGAGTLEDLQRLKIGLNYKYDQNPEVESVIKALRSDLRAEIEQRVEAGVKAGVLPSHLSGIVKALNKDWGEMADLKGAFIKRAYRDLGGDVIEDVLSSGRTSGGVGTLNLATASTGNPIFSAIGALLSVGRTPEGKSAIADLFSDIDRTRLPGLLAPVVREGLNARTNAQIYDAVHSKQEAIQSQAKARSLSSSSSQRPTNPKLGESVPPGPPPAPARTSRSDRTIPETPLSSDRPYSSLFTPSKSTKDIERRIDSDPYLKAVYETESGRNPKAKNPKSSASGAFQLTKDTARALGVKDPFNLAESFIAMKDLTAEHRERFGNDPFLLYAAHFLGATTLDKVLKGKSLTKEQAEHVRDLREVAMPRFRRHYKPGVVAV